MEVIIRESPLPGMEEVVFTLDLDDEVGPREFDKVFAPQLIHEHRLVPWMPGDSRYFIREDNSDSFIGLRKKEEDMSKKHHNENQEPESKPVEDQPIAGGEPVSQEPIAGGIDVSQPAPEEPTESTLKVDAQVTAVEQKEAVPNGSYPILDPEDTNTVRKLWETGEINPVLLSDMKMKYQVEGDVTFTLLGDGTVSFIDPAQIQQAPSEPLSESAAS